MAPKEKGKKRKTAIVVAQPVVVEEEEELTADQLRHIAEPWFTSIPAQVSSLAKKAQWGQGVGGNHAAVNPTQPGAEKQLYLDD